MLYYLNGLSRNHPTYIPHQFKRKFCNVSLATTLFFCLFVLFFIIKIIKKKYAPQTNIDVCVHVHCWPNR